MTDNVGAQEDMSFETVDRFSQSVEIGDCTIHIALQPCTDLMRIRTSGRSIGQILYLALIVMRLRRYAVNKIRNNGIVGQSISLLQ